MKKSVKWVAATAAVMLTLSASVGVTSSADEGTTVKAGFIFLHDENSTYDLNFINAAKEAFATRNSGSDTTIIQSKEKRK